MDKQLKELIGLFTRYFTILLFGIGDLYLIYKILTPITIQTLNSLLSIFINTTLVGNIIYMDKTIIEIVPACVAGAAFYLLLFLLLSIKDINPKTRIKAIATAFAMLFILNISRILILIPMINISYFETIHWIFWHLVSIVFVVVVWFSVIKIYKIKSIPIYSDFKYIKGLINPIKKSKRKKKHK